VVPGTEETVRVANTSGAGVGTPTSGATSGNPVPASSTGGVGSRDDFPAPVPLDGDLPSTPVNTGTAGGSPGTRVMCSPALVATPLGAADTIGTLMHFSKERVKGQSPEALQAEAKTCYLLMNFQRTDIRRTGKSIKQGVVRHANHVVGFFVTLVW